MSRGNYKKESNYKNPFDMFNDDLGFSGIESFFGRQGSVFDEFDRIQKHMMRG